MKILAIQGSPRQDGNTAAVLDIVMDSAKEAGAEVEVVHLTTLTNLSGCRECNACNANLEEPSCVIKDDMQPILTKVLACDIVLWATPVFCWSPTWLTKTAMDRFYCMLKFLPNGKVKSLLKGGRVAALITAGGGENDGADIVTDIFKRMANYTGSDWLGAFVAASQTTPDAARSDSDLAKRAQEFGRQLAG